MKLMLKDRLRVTEIFASIQGEGKQIGRPTVFVRMSQCNLRCSWCDAKYALEGGRDFTVDEVVNKVNEFNLGSVCITGGEPMLQLEPLKDLVKKLNQIGYEITLETNGTLYDKWVFDNVACVSMDVKPPSSGEESNEELVKKLGQKDQVKIVIADDKDYDFAKEILKKTSVEVILQPLGGIKLKAIVDRVMDDRLDVRVLPQLHKIIGVR